MKSIRIPYSLALLLIFSSCASVKAPSGTVPTRQNLLIDAFGGYLTIALKSGDTTTFTTGELIAVSPDTIFVLTDMVTKGYEVTGIDSARVIFFNKISEVYAAWTILLVAGTASNGFFSVATAPLALIVGSASAAGEAKRINYYDYPEHPWKDLGKYARFPQGLPPGIHLSDLTPRSKRNPK